VARPWWLPSDSAQSDQTPASAQDVRWPARSDPRVIAGETLEEAMRTARQHFGAHVQFVAARTVSRGLKGLLGREEVEVLVAAASMPAGPAGSAMSGAGPAGAATSDDPDGHAFATLEELLEIADSADGVGQPPAHTTVSRPKDRSFERAFEREYAQAIEPEFDYDFDPETITDNTPRPFSPTATPLSEVSFEALVRQALDRVPSEPVRNPGAALPRQHPAPEIVVDPVAVPRRRPTPKGRSQLALAGASAASPKWSRRRLTAVGVPRALADALPLRSSDDDAGWMAELTAALAEAIESARDAAGSTPAATMSGRGGKGAIAIVKALTLGVVPDELDDGHGMRPATAESLAAVIRSLL
jgi:hypothetical protein